MNTNPAIEPVDGALAVLEELKRQRTEGVRHLYIEDSTLAGLEKVLGADQTQQDVKNISARPVPEISQGRAVSFPQVEEVTPLQFKKSYRWSNPTPRPIIQSF